MSLPASYLLRPYAHRGLHGSKAGIMENSRSAFDAAVAKSYGIELDVQIARDGVPVVFHDPKLDRLTDRRGPLCDLTAAQLAGLRLGGSDDGIEPLADVLDRIDGRVPVLIEIKDQTGDIGPEQAVGQVIAAAATGETRPRLAVMSFRHDYIHALNWLPPWVLRGLTTEGDAPITAFKDGLAFISHSHATLDTPAVARVKQLGASVLCWTIRSQDQAATALRHADQITFEGFSPA